MVLQRVMTSLRMMWPQQRSLWFLTWHMVWGFGYEGMGVWVFGAMICSKDCDSVSSAQKEGNT